MSFIKYIADESPYKEVLSLVGKAKQTVWIGTADIKDLYVDDKPIDGAEYISLEDAKRLKLPYFEGLAAGYPSPAGDYQHESLDLNEKFVHHPDPNMPEQFDQEDDSEHQSSGLFKFEKKIR